MKAKVKATGEIVEVEKNGFGSIYSASDGNHYFGTDLDFNLDSPHPEATISGWVARTQNGTLGLLRINPERKSGDWWINLPPKDSAIYKLPPELFPFLTWQDDPIEVEIVIKPKKQ